MSVDGTGLDAPSIIRDCTFTNCYFEDAINDIKDLNNDIDDCVDE